MERAKVRGLAMKGFFVAAMVVCAWIAIPIGEISITLQSFGLYLALFMLGGKQGSTVFGVYLLMGAVGLPVFSGFRGGWGVLLSVTGGYLWGFALSGPVYWLVTHFYSKKGKIPAAILGMLLCYGCGSLWYMYVYADASAWQMVLLKCVVPYLLPDTIKVALAYSLSERLQKIIGQT